MKKTLLMVALAMLTMMSGYAQDSLQVKNMVHAMVKKYESVKGVDCVTVEKGSGLGLVKPMFNKHLGKEFMRGVTSVTIINYSDASEQICQDFRKELDVFASLLEEFVGKEEEKDPKQDYIRCFASVSKEDGTLSDFLITIEDEEQKMFLYMEGVMKVIEPNSRQLLAAPLNPSQTLQRTFARHGVKVEWIPLETLIKGYGAAHCMTQVIKACQ